MTADLGRFFRRKPRPPQGLTADEQAEADRLTRILNAIDSAARVRPRIEDMPTKCNCDMNPETTDGPSEDCPEHGNVRLYAHLYAEANKEISRLQGRVAIQQDAIQGLDEEITDILTPLVAYLVEHHPDRYGGRHCIDVALELLAEADHAIIEADNSR